DKGEVREARALLETRNFAGKADGTLVRLLSVYSDVIRMQGDAGLADRYEELARRTAKATGTLYGDEDIDPNANVEIVTLEELELPEAETGGESTDDAALQAVDREFDPEIVDELEEILADAQAADAEAGDAQAGAGETAEAEEEPVSTETA